MSESSFATTSQVKVIAGLLPEPWRYAEAQSDGTHCLAGPDGMALVIRRYVGPHGVRLAMHGRYLDEDGRTACPHHLGALVYGEEAPTLSVGAADPVEDIVREMLRRFLPDYVALFRQGEMIAVERRVRRLRIQGVQQELLHILQGGRITARLPARPVAGEIHFQKSPQCRHGVVSIGDVGDTCDLRLTDLPPALAGQILALVAAA